MKNLKSETLIDQSFVFMECKMKNKSLINFINFLDFKRRFQRLNLEISSEFRPKVNKVKIDCPVNLERKYKKLVQTP